MQEYVKGLEEAPELADLLKAGGGDDDDGDGGGDGGNGGDATDALTHSNKKRKRGKGAIQYPRHMKEKDLLNAIKTGDLVQVRARAWLRLGLPRRPLPGSCARGMRHSPLTPRPPPFPIFTPPASRSPSRAPSRRAQGTFRQSRNNFLEGTVVRRDGDDVILGNRMAINRAIDGDIVAVRVLPPDQWVRPSNAVVELDDADAADLDKAAPDAGDEGRTVNAKPTGVVSVDSCLGVLACCVNERAMR